MITGITDKLEFILSGTGTSQEEFNQIIDLMEEYKALNIPCVIVPCCDNPKLDIGMQHGFGKNLCKNCGGHIAI